MNKDFANNWREAYRKMVVFANDQLKNEIRPYISIYAHADLRKPSILVLRYTKFALS